MPAILKRLCRQKRSWQTLYLRPGKYQLTDTPATPRAPYRTPEGGQFMEVDEHRIRLRMKESDGKITDSGHDQIVCCFTAIPAHQDLDVRAKLQVNAFLEHGVPNFQEGFGLFLRDSVGLDRQTGYAYSNMVLLGGCYGRCNIFARFGVTPGNMPAIENNVLHGCSQDMVPFRVPNGKPRVLTLSLQKRGDCVRVRMTDERGADMLRGTNPTAAQKNPRIEALGGGEYMVYMPEDALTAMEKDQYYLGFLAARGADISVEMKKLHVKVRKRRDCACTPPQTEETTPNVTAVPTFMPKPAASAPEEVWPLIHPALVVSPDESSMNLAEAIRTCLPGQEISLRSGVYHLNESVWIDADHSGDAAHPKLLSGPKDGPAAILDFGGRDLPLAIAGDYWVVRDITVTNGLGIRIHGNHNRLLRCKAVANREVGIYIADPDRMSPADQWPAHNLVQDCVSCLNRDPSGQNADGFACKLAAGEGNRFEGCVSFLNTDDGYDLFSKDRPIGAVTLVNCHSFLNGFEVDANGTLTKSPGNGNGFKLGGSGLCIEHKAIRCVAFGNRAAGFTSNSNPFFSLDECAAMDNGQNFKYWYAAANAAITMQLRACRSNYTPGFDTSTLMTALCDRLGVH